MDILLKNIFKLLRVLHSETGIHQLSAGFAAGFVLGMTPVLSIQSLLIFLFILFFRIQFGAAIVGAFVFSFVAFALDPLFHRVGLSMLENESLIPLWSNLYNMPLVPFTRFNNSIVLGAGVVAFALTPFVYISSYFLIKKYRRTVVTRFKGSAFFKALKASKFYQMYQRYNAIYAS